jgi:hypothetical protein
MKPLLYAGISLFTLSGLLMISSITRAEGDISGKCNMDCVCDGSEIHCQRDHGEYIDEGDNKVICSLESREGSSIIVFTRPDFVEEPRMVYCTAE